MPTKKLASVLQTPVGEPLLTRSEAGRRLNTYPRRINEMIASGELEIVEGYPGKHAIIRQSSVDALAARMYQTQNQGG